MTRKMFIYRAGRVHSTDYDYSRVPQVVGTRVILVCPEHGLFERLTREFLRGRGCAQCRDKGRRRELLEEFVREARRVHGDKYDYARVGVTYPRVTITCRVHGDFEQSKYHHLRGSGCPSCKAPFNQPSSLAAKWLDSLGLPDDPQHRKVVVPGGRIRVGGFDPNTNTVYEFYGDTYHGNLKRYPPEMISLVTGKTFGQMNLERLERERLIQEAGFQLVTMWEFDFKNPEGKLPSSSGAFDYLADFIQENDLAI